MRPIMLMLLIACWSGFAFANENAPSLSGVALVEAKGCVSCHGKDGNGAVVVATGKIDPQYPLLAGQYASYLEFALKSYRNGTRKNAVMAGFATPLTDAEIKALALYFSTQDSKLKTLKGVE
jgi:cytochrome c553